MKTSVTLRPYNKMVFNEDHYSKVRKEKYTDGAHSVTLKHHPLLGKAVLKLSDMKEGFIESVIKQWYHGWYILLVINYNGSHGAILWDNLSCNDPIIKNEIDDSKLKYQIKE